MAYFFPSPIPTVTHDLWFKTDARKDEHIILLKEEDEFYKTMKKEVSKGQDFVPIGKTKEQQTEADADEDDVEDDESAEEDLEDDTDEFDTPSPDLVSMDDEVEMGDTSLQNVNSGDNGEW